MRKINLIMSVTILLLSLAACAQSGGYLLDTSKYTWYPDSIVQDKYVAKALSATAIKSDYQSPANQYQSSLINFKFSINGKDNEMPEGLNHSFFCTSQNGRIETPVITFGEQLKTMKKDDGKGMPNDTRLTIRLDMRQVFQGFKKNGFYVTQTGQKIYKDDFKGVYVAGDATPLIWDFDNLVNHHELQLYDEDGDGIFETTLVLNPKVKKEQVFTNWKLSNNITAYPQYDTPYLLENALYNMALDEMANAIEPDKTLRTGKEWAGVWTRDVSYSIILSMAYMQPKVSMNSLMRKVNANGRIIQDTGTGGAWPCSSDRMIWAVAAWEIYLVTGNEQWLKTIYPIIKNSIEDDFLTVYDKETGLVMAESSFIDWRDQSYPRWMQPVDIYQSKCLGTNAVHVQALTLLGKMAGLLNNKTDAAKYKAKADNLRKAINTYLWMPDKKYYAQYLYGRNSNVLSPRSETLGEALSILFDVAGPGRQKEIAQHVPVMPFGVPVFYPQISDMPPYHNKAVWPFVSSYWMHASAKAGNETGVLEAIGSIYRAAALFGTNKENFVVTTGDYMGTQINSSNMLWSLSGNISIPHKLFFGINFTENGLAFHPFVPKALTGKRTLTNFKYREAKLNIELEGYGNVIKSFSLDGNKMNPLLSPTISGEHIVKIILANNTFDKNTINRVENMNSPQVPIVRNDNGKLLWNAINYAVSYTLLKNGEILKDLKDTTITIPVTSPGEYQVMAIDKAGVSSFASEPIILKKNLIQTYEVERYAPKTSYAYQGYNGEGFSEVSKTANKIICIPIIIEEAGIYSIDWRYANGNGPTNTENKCAIRTLSIDDNFTGISVFPQRGKGEWSNWGWSNSTHAFLTTGKHNIYLKFLPANENMNLEINQAMLDQLRITFIK